MLSTEEELSKLKEEKNQARICASKTPKVWQWCDKLRATYSKGAEKQENWTNVSAAIYESDCRFHEHCNINCKIVIRIL